MILRIQSFTDVITNSSSSVFVMQSDIADKYRNIEGADDCIAITPITINWLHRNPWEAEMVCNLLHVDPKTIMNYRETRYGGYYADPSQEIWDKFLKDHREQIKIQSISDIITNSSTEVFTVYQRYNIQDIKDLVNALFKLISNLRFDDFFTITLHINEYVIIDLYNCYEELQDQFDSSEELYTYLKGLSDQEIQKYEYMANQMSDFPVPFYSGYTVKQKPEVELTPRLLKALQKLNNLDCLFRYEYGEIY